MSSSLRRSPLLPPTTEDRDPLLAALATIRQRGAIGERSLVAAVAHAERFVDALPPSAANVVDLGSGGGLPGLVIAVRRFELHVTLVERRRSRADLLRRACTALQLGERVTVRDVDVAFVAAARPASFDVVTARGFGPPAVTARWAGRLLRPGGTALISEPPDGGDGRWPPDLLISAGLIDDGSLGGIRRLRGVAR